MIFSFWFRFVGSGLGLIWFGLMGYIWSDVHACVCLSFFIIACLFSVVVLFELGLGLGLFLLVYLSLFMWPDQTVRYFLLIGVCVVFALLSLFDSRFSEPLRASWMIRLLFALVELMVDTAFCLI